MIGWIYLIIILVIIEACTVSLVTVWYVASAVLAYIFSLYNDSLLIQVGIFAIVGTLLLITTRKKLQGLMDNKRVNTNIDRIIGYKGIVTADIVNGMTGEVKVDGKRWSAVGDTDILEGSQVIVLEINSVKLKVKKVEE